MTLRPPGRREQTPVKVAGTAMSANVEQQVDMQSLC